LWDNIKYYFFLKEVFFMDLSPQNNRPMLPPGPPGPASLSSNAIKGTIKGFCEGEGLLGRLKGAKEGHQEGTHNELELREERKEAYLEHMAERNEALKDDPLAEGLTGLPRAIGLKADESIKNAGRDLIDGISG
jgi:hypothetical protein